MQLVTLEVVDTTTYDHLIGIVKVMQGVRICNIEETLNAVQDPEPLYNTTETAAQQMRYESLLSMCGAVKSTGIADTEREIARIREGWL